MPAFLAGLGALGDFLKVLLTALGWLKEEREKQTGIDLQAGADSKAALATVLAENAARDAAPVDQAGVMNSLEAGSF